MRLIRVLRRNMGRACAEESGQTMAEYGLILSLLSVALIFALTTIGTTISGFFTSFAAGL